MALFYGSDDDNLILRAGNDIKTCKSPIDGHNGKGESVDYIDINSDSSGFCESAVCN
ncbi:MAG TPA: hypothetical protein VJ203_11295 [Bacteroidales bacterium]|nr:hypothetical protein [Bacteroidales bacterium]